VDSGIQRVAISIDGADEATHDSFRRQPGSLAAALNGFRHLRRLGMSMQINCTVTKHNVDQIETLYSKALELGADALHLFMLVPVGCGVQIAESNMLPSEEYERVLNWMYDRSQAGKIHLKATCAPHYFRVMRQREAEERRSGVAAAVPAAHPVGGPDSVVHGSPDPAHLMTAGLHHHGQETLRSNGTARSGDLRRTESGNAHPRGVHPQGMAAMTKGCLAGSSICFVSHTGEVFPCGYLPVSAGNVRRQSMSDIWNGSEVFARLRNVDELEGKCGLCEFKRICLGCRARAFYESHGNYMAEEPFCVYEPKKMRDLDHVFKEL
jgi:radical SAM protein with 4Fe4S-binding SPASM domain